MELRELEDFTHTIIENFHLEVIHPHLLRQNRVIRTLQSHDLKEVYKMFNLDDKSFREMEIFVKTTIDSFRKHPNESHSVCRRWSKDCVF